MPPWLNVEGLPKKDIRTTFFVYFVYFVVQKTAIIRVQ